MDKAELSHQTISTGLKLQPITPPGILGIYAFAASAIMEATWLAGWYGSNATAFYLAPFVAGFGGFAQLAAALSAYRSRNVLVAAIAAMWGTQHFAWAFLYLLFATSILPQPAGAFPSFGLWYVALALITATGAVAAIPLGLTLTLTLAAGALGAAIFAVEEFFGLEFLIAPGAYTLIFCGLAGWYTANALLLQQTYGRAILPVGHILPGKAPAPIDRGFGEAGVRKNR